MDKVNILGTEIDKVNVEQASDTIIKFIQDGEKCKYVFTPNSEILMNAYRNKEFCNVLNSASILTADGIGVVYASRILKNPISERCAGYDTAVKLIEKMAKYGYSLYLFGAKPGVAEKAAENMQKNNPGIKIAGTADGYFDAEKEKKIIDDINQKKPDVLFVCLGAPKQEMWIYQNRDKLDVHCCLGIGGSLDVFAGTAQRAPDFYCRHGIEWLYRLAKQPSRFGRMMDLPKFGLTVLFKGKRFK